jgi:hypothetical protein
MYPLLQGISSNSLRCENNVVISHRQSTGIEIPVIKSFILITRFDHKSNTRNFIFKI